MLLKSDRSSRRRSAGRCCRTRTAAATLPRSRRRTSTPLRPNSHSARRRRPRSRRRLDLRLEGRSGHPRSRYRALVMFPWVVDVLPRSVVTVGRARRPAHRAVASDLAASDRRSRPKAPKRAHSFDVDVVRTRLVRERAVGDVVVWTKSGPTWRPARPPTRFQSQPTCGRAGRTVPDPRERQQSPISRTWATSLPLRTLRGSGGGARTHDLLINSQSLLPAELPRKGSG